MHRASGSPHSPENVDLGERAAIAAQRVELDQAVLQRLAGDQLQLRVERGAHREPALVERVLAVAGDDLAAHLLGEIFAGEQVGADRRGLTPSGSAFAFSPSSRVT